MQADVGHYLKVRATDSDGHGLGNSAEAVPRIAVPGAPN